MLVGENLVKSFERNEKRGKKTEFNAVDNISIKVSQGEIVGIIGANGAGKTTLLRMLAGLMKPTSGQVVMWDGDEKIENELAMKGKIGYLSGNTKLYGRLSTRELLDMIGKIHGLDVAEIEERIAEISKVLNMDSFIDNRIEKLSTGQTQRASISRCLIHSPNIYIFDEPTLGLDILSSSAIIEFMCKEKENGKGVVYSTHYMEEAEYLCDRIIMIGKGRIIGSGTLDEMRNKTGFSSLREIFGKLASQEEDLYEC
ncbi:MAG: ATP-binding cassette domain-containing protein [Clostridium sp.]|nr:ATP-binding cassette domain-containing protein [Clostridium sp.]MCM1399723.1 ATP-binding cassette domain-containing protein [Clostridium sp.]MCM1460442.1 ATP-binding cassette domain-containing protein [Bacteroides sp.]